MYVRYMLLSCLLGISAILSAQGTDQTRLNIRIFPVQTMSVHTSNDSAENQKQSPSQISSREITVSSVYGYQIQVRNENNPDKKKEMTTLQKNSTKNCETDPLLLYTSTLAEINKKLLLTNIISEKHRAAAGCITDDAGKMYVYTIISQ